MDRLSKSSPPLAGAAPVDCSHSRTGTSANRVLAGLPHAEMERLRPALCRVALQRGQILRDTYKSIDSLYFPVDGMIGLLAVMADGRTVVLGATGSQGFIGVPAVFAADMPASRVLSLLDGEAYQLAAAKLPGLLSDNPQFAAALRGYAAAAFSQIAQVGACNALHSVQQRVALWLLLTQDYSGAGPIPFTHESLSELVGCRRSSVTDVLSFLEAAGMVRGGRAEIEITDPPQLERTACECYHLLSRTTIG